MTFCGSILLSSPSCSYNFGMSRTRSHLRCDVCGAEPEFRDGRLVCRCSNFQWSPRKGYGGTAVDRELLGRYGWRMASDQNGFTFWVGPGNLGVVYLYEDGTWSGGSGGFDELEDYLNWYARGEH
jgi:hypothetical protein